MQDHNPRLHKADMEVNQTSFVPMIRPRRGSCLFLTGTTVKSRIFPLQTPLVSRQSPAKAPHRLARIV